MAIQDACGWEDCHLYSFLTPDREEVIAGIPDDDLGPPDPDAIAIKLSSVFDGESRQSCTYQYDFGDCWMHEVVVEGVERHSERFARRLLEGAGTFPPEDCGSAYGYERCVAAATGKGWTGRFGDDKERRETLDWLGDWRPDSFNLDAAKQEFDA